MDFYRTGVLRCSPAFSQALTGVSPAWRRRAFCMAPSGITFSPVSLSVAKHTLEKEPPPKSLCRVYFSPTCQQHVLYLFSKHC